MSMISALIQRQILVRINTPVFVIEKKISYVITFQVRPYLAQNIGQCRNYFAVNKASRLANFSKYLKVSKPLSRFTTTSVTAELSTAQSKWVGRWLGTCAGMCFGAVVIGTLYN